MREQFESDLRHTRSCKLSQITHTSRAVEYDVLSLPVHSKGSQSLTSKTPEIFDCGHGFCAPQGAWIHLYTLRPKVVITTNVAFVILSVIVMITLITSVLISAVSEELQSQPINIPIIAIINS